MKTIHSKDTHYVGIGICKQKIYQVKIKDTNDIHTDWILCRLENGILIPFGKSKERYKIKENA